MSHMANLCRVRPVRERERHNYTFVNILIDSEGWYSQKKTFFFFFSSFKDYIRTKKRRAETV